jgi:LysM repeat protein
MARPAGSHPAWERPAKAEHFPRLHSRDERSSNSPLLLAMVGVAILVVFLFAWPFLTNQGSKTPVATHTPSATATAVTSTTPTSSASVLPTPVPSGGFVYTVQTNDTVTGIAQKYGVSPEAILALNPQITDAALIHIGDQIRIPPTGTGLSASPSSSAS